MTLILDNDDMKAILTMETTMKALEEAYREIFRNEAVCRPRIDIQIPTEDPTKIYQWGTMDGGSTSGYFAIRMKSDVIYEREYLGTRTQENYCVRPGKFCGLILLINIQNGEPVALINDGYLQHMRVGADCGIGLKIHGPGRRSSRGDARRWRYGQVSYGSLYISATHKATSSLQSNQGAQGRICEADGREIPYRSHCCG